MARTKALKGPSKRRERNKTQWASTVGNSNKQTLGSKERQKWGMLNEPVSSSIKDEHGQRAYKSTMGQSLVAMAETTWERKKTKTESSQTTMLWLEHHQSTLSQCKGGGPMVKQRVWFGGG